MSNLGTIVAYMDTLVWSLPFCPHSTLLFCFYMSGKKYINANKAHLTVVLRNHSRTYGNADLVLAFLPSCPYSPMLFCPRTLT